MRYINTAILKPLVCQQLTNIARVLVDPSTVRRESKKVREKSSSIVSSGLYILRIFTKVGTKSLI